MPKKKDKFCEYVMFLGDKESKWKCMFCRKDYGGGGTRIKAHLAKAKRYGIKECERVPDQVRAQACEALYGKGVQDQDSAGDGNKSPHRHSITTTITQDANEPPLREDNLPNASHEARLVEVHLSHQMLPAKRSNSIPMDHHHVQDMNEKAVDVTQGQSQPQPQPQAQNLCYNGPSTQRLKEGTVGRSQQPPNAEQTDTEFLFSQDLRTNAPLENQPHGSRPAKRKLEEFSCSKEMLASGCRKRAPLMTTKLVGKYFEAKVNEICTCLMKDETSIIGLCGMGGVGKTAIAMHVYNQILANAAFNDVFWITIPHEFSVYELQSAIADATNIASVSKDKDEKRRAARLFSYLKRKDKWVIILDGLWTHFKLEDVGIPKVVTGNKLVLTTRSIDVCRRMLCQEQIIIEPLTNECEECEKLFLEKLSMSKEFYLEVKQTMSRLIKKCGGLPLGIIEVATRMSKKENVLIWRDMLEMLETSKMKLEVFKTLELSYRSLDDDELQQCFLHCVLYCLDDESKPYIVVESLIDEGLACGMHSRERLHNKCRIMLDKLKNAFLLEVVDDNNGGEVKIHPLIRDMVLQMMSKKYMVMPKMNLEDMPDTEFWWNNLEKVSLANNKIKEIPSYLSPNCPRLTTLLLNGNKAMEMIPDPFFKYLLGLEVLNLSDCGIKELPKSISNLVNLRALVLKGCSALNLVPDLGKLRSLRKLDLRECDVLDELPKGVESLVNLSYLDLLGTGIEMFEEGFLAKLENLQYLGIANVILEAKKLKKLRMFDGRFSDVEAFNASTKFIAHESLHKYRLQFHKDECVYDEDVDPMAQEFKVVVSNCDQIVVVTEGRNCDGCLLLPQTVKLLQVTECRGMTKLSEMGPLKCLEVLYIERWEILRMLWGGLDDVAFPCLVELRLFECPKVKYIFAHGTALSFLHLRCIEIRDCEEMEGITEFGLQLWLPSCTLPRLECIKVHYCRQMKQVVGCVWLPLLPSLREIQVTYCYEMEEIVAGPHLLILKPEAFFPLAHLHVFACHKMRKLFSHELSVHLLNLESLRVENCNEMEEIIGGGPQRQEYEASCLNTTHSSHLSFLPSSCCFPKLKQLSLRRLAQVKRICDGTLICDKIESIELRNCPKLGRVPLRSPPPSSLRKIEMDNEAAWESLDWGHPSAFNKSLLRPLARFSPDNIPF